MKLDMSLYILNNLISIAQLHSYKAFTENDGKLTQDMRGYKCQTEDIKKIIAWLHEKVFEH